MSALLVSALLTFWDFFRRILIDAEFFTDAYGRVRVHCICGIDLGSGRSFTYTADQLRRLPRNPFTHPAPTLLFCYSAMAELASLQEFWPEPVWVFDLYDAYRMTLNGAIVPESLYPLVYTSTKTGSRPKRSGVTSPPLLKALAHHGLPAMDAAKKDFWRQKAMQAPVLSGDTLRGLTAYCLEDVYAEAGLVSKVLHRVPFRTMLLSGFFSAALVRARRIGIPINPVDWGLFREYGARFYRDLFTNHAVTDLLTPTFNISPKKFSAFLERENIAWARKPSGNPETSTEYLRQHWHLHPVIEQLWAVRSLQDLHPARYQEIAVHPDHRHRFFAAPNASRSGRCAPRASLLTRPGWTRGYGEVPPGQRLVEFDFKAEEPLIAGVLANDQGVIADYQAQDFYHNMGVRLGSIPKTAPVGTYRTERNEMKPAILGNIYGSGAKRLAGQLHISVQKAQRLMDRIALAYPNLKQFAARNYVHALQRGVYLTKFGWTIYLQDTVIVNSHTMKNLPIQSLGADILKLSVVLAVDCGVQVIGTLHDSLLISTPEDQWQEHVALTERCMRAASAAALGGIEIKIETTVYGPGDRLLKDPKDSERFYWLLEQLRQAEKQQSQVEQHPPGPESTLWTNEPAISTVTPITQNRCPDDKVVENSFLGPLSR